MGMSEEEHTQREPSPTDMGLTFEATADSSSYVRRWLCQVDSRL